MSEFPSVEADELVTKQFLRAELGSLRSELRLEMVERFQRQTIWLVATVVAVGAAIITAMPLVS